ncbi:unnamed protein product [Toxocara canis]|uniref:Uncharacterized protein n=1 Tax=Toxocara canis TaxID=6265 RepID=A0A183VHI4_TOXCA|nr:unnamed protein product [Toxocara canis]
MSAVIGTASQTFAPHALSWSTRRCQWMKSGVLPLKSERMQLKFREIKCQQLIDRSSALADFLSSHTEDSHHHSSSFSARCQKILTASAALPVAVPVPADGAVVVVDCFFAPATPFCTVHGSATFAT